MAAAVFAPLYYLLGDRAAWYVDKNIALMLVAIGALLVYRHRENISKLLKGTESKLGASKQVGKEAGKTLARTPENTPAKKAGQ